MFNCNVRSQVYIWLWVLTYIKPGGVDFNRAWGGGYKWLHRSTSHQTKRSKRKLIESHRNVSRGGCLIRLERDELFIECKWVGIGLQVQLWQFRLWNCSSQLMIKCIPKKTFAVMFTWLQHTEQLLLSFVYVLNLMTGLLSVIWINTDSCHAEYLLFLDKWLTTNHTYNSLVCEIKTFF